MWLDTNLAIYPPVIFPFSSEKGKVYRDGQEKGPRQYRLSQLSFTPTFISSPHYNYITPISTFNFTTTSPHFALHYIMEIIRKGTAAVPTNPTFIPSITLIHNLYYFPSFCITSHDEDHTERGRGSAYKDYCTK